MKAPFQRNNTESEQPTVIAPAATPTAPAEALDPPAPDVAPLSIPQTPSRNRSKLRRRMRYLRRAHELGLRDLGGLVFDLHRFGKRNDQLVVGKLQALETVDAELRAIERVLGAQREVTELREPGITACVRCGGLYGTDARFCPSCGTQVDGLVAVGSAPAQTPAAAAAPVSPPPAPPTPTPTPTPTPQPMAPAPPLPPSGPAPSAPPLWSVPQPTGEHPVVEEEPPTAATPTEPTP